MSVEITCPDCDWTEGVEGVTDDHPMYCPKCGSRTEMDYESEVNLSEVETKTDKI